MNRIRKRQATFLRHVMRREKLENLERNEKIGEKLRRGKQREKMVDGLTKWLKIRRVTDTLKATTDRDAWKVINRASVCLLID